MNCAKCGNLLGEGNRFCRICGTPVGTWVQPQFSAPAGGTAPASVPQQVSNAAPFTVPYAPPSMQDGNIIIPVKRKFRIVCPDCHKVSEDLKRDDTPGFPCRFCGKTYAYGGQVLFYRMGNGMPSCSLLHVNIMVDGVIYGEISNRESVRIMLSNGTHVIGMKSSPVWPYPSNNSNQFQIIVGPQSNNLAFKLSIVYRHMASNGLELAQCAPQDVPDI